MSTECPKTCGSNLWINGSGKLDMFPAWALSQKFSAIYSNVIEELLIKGWHMLGPISPR